MSSVFTLETPIGLIDFTVHGEIEPSTYTIKAQQIPPSLPDGMNVESCHAVLLELTSEDVAHNIAYTCIWRDPDLIDCCPEPGEGLDSLACDKGAIRVQIGTEDEEFLLNRLLLPDVHFSSDSYPIKYLPHGMSIHLQKILPQRPLSLHFIVAWNSLPEPVDASCWYAVDKMHRQILEAFHSS